MRRDFTCECLREELAFRTRLASTPDKSKLENLEGECCCGDAGPRMPVPDARGRRANEEKGGREREKLLRLFFLFFFLFFRDARLLVGFFLVFVILVVRDDDEVHGMSLRHFELGIT